MTGQENKYIQMLKDRLASGDVTIDRYYELLAVLQRPTSGIRRHATTKQQFDPGGVIAVIDDIQLFKNHIRVGGDLIPLSEVDDVSGDRISYSVNFLPVAKLTTCVISFKNGKSVRISEDRTYFGGQRHKAISNFIATFRHATFASRLREAFDSLILNKTMLIGSTKKDYVFLDSSGCATCGDKSVDLRIARENGIYEVGRAGIYLGLTKSYNPNEALLSEDPGHLRLIPRSAIRFEISTNGSDVVKTLLEMFSSGEIPFKC